MIIVVFEIGRFSNDSIIFRIVYLVRWSWRVKNILVEIGNN